MSQTNVRRRRQSRQEARASNAKVRRRKRGKQGSCPQIPSYRALCMAVAVLALWSIASWIASSPQKAHHAKKSAVEAHSDVEHNSTATGTVTTKCGKPNNGDPAHPPPRYMSESSNPVYFLHIGKAGGTSVDALFLALLNGTDKRYIGDLHYDYSYIQQKQQQLNRNINLRGGNEDMGSVDVSRTADVITFLRHPVSRAASQFYFSKGLPWMEKSHQKARFQTFDEYLDDPNKTWTQPIADGESGADFLAGIFPSEEGFWVATDERETEEKKYLRRNKTAAALLAAERLEQTTWFGLLEEPERSMNLLQITLGLDAMPVLPKENSQRQHHPKPSMEAVEKIKRYIPKDLWLYEYAKLLFEARWEYFVGGQCVYTPPELPALPDFG